jgi:dihydroflavonol-4-reductase
MSKRTVAVTGASGFIGSHVVRVLLEAGHEVRATVRDPSDRARTAYLSALPGNERLSLVAGDLGQEGSFDGPFDGCEWVCHVASPVSYNPKDPIKDIIEPAVEGTLNVLRSAERCGVKRVALTSSVAAVLGWEARSGRYTEQDWNETSTAERSAYPRSKTLAEKAAWEFVDGRRLELVTILPCYVFGPVMTPAHCRTSTAFIYRMVMGKMPMFPRMSLPMVDVEAVAQAHRAALEVESANGRYILSNEARWVGEIAALIRQRHPELPAPRHASPDLLVYLKSLFDDKTSLYFWRCALGREVMLDGSRVERELGVRYQPWEETVLETVASIRAVVGR